MKILSLEVRVVNKLHVSDSIDGSNNNIQLHSEEIFIF